MGPLVTTESGHPFDIPFERRHPMQGRCPHHCLGALRCGGTGDLHHGCSADKFAAIDDEIMSSKYEKCFQPLVESMPQRLPAVLMGSIPVLAMYSIPNKVAGFLRLSFDELKKITGNFDERPVNEGGSRLGEGGFGTVYYGHVNGRPVAVKKLHTTEDFSLEELSVQFNQEIQTLMVLKHENLVDMVGFSLDGHPPCLLYAYMSNGSLLDRLACSEGSPPLCWHRRCLVALGTARGLDYLHRNNHVHRDVKSGNILLDELLVPKISDFGLTRASATRSSSTVMTERIMGTTAYMAKEALRGEITPKSDIYSFGVVLLEILSGLPPVDENRDPKFLMEIKDEIDEEEVVLEDFVDMKMTDWDFPTVEKTYALASDCLNDKKNKRPPMEEVLSVLQDVVKGISLEDLGPT